MLGRITNSVQQLINCFGVALAVGLAVYLYYQPTLCHKTLGKLTGGKDCNGTKKTLFAACIGCTVLVLLRTVSGGGGGGYY